jgi:hypothetical protein
VNQTLSQKLKPLFVLLLLTAVALLVHGYHPFAEDAEIYLPGVEKILHPNLFPATVDREFFLSHASLTLFPNLIAFTLRVTHLPMVAGLFIWHLASIFLLLLACWELSGLFFSSASARWCGVCLVEALLTIPVAGTALYIMDQYLNPRNLAAFAGIFALTRTLQKKYVSAALWLVFAGLMHPMMWVFPFSFCALLLVMEKYELYWKERELPLSKAMTTAGLIWLTFPLMPPSSFAYEQVAKSHAYHYIQHWQWYELLGAIAPMFLFGWFARIARRRHWVNVERASCAFVAYGVIYLVAALAIDLPPRFETLARLQPLRSLHLLYIVMFVLIGGLLGEYVLKNRIWRWLLLFVPLSAGMLFAQRALFPASAQVEWPGVAPRNPWAQTFLWIRKNTPVDAVFALDPEYMHVPGEDEIGFRCLAERTRIADAVKDNGVVSMFPPLAGPWWTQVQAESPWNKFQLADFMKLKNEYGVNWVVLQEPGIAGLDCLYDNGVLRVCRIP